MIVITASNSPLKIAICLAHFHPVVGGAERKMQQLAERWTRCGHRSFVLTRAMSELPAREMLGDVEINRVIRARQLGPLFGATFISSLAAHLLRRSREFDVMVAGQLPWEAVATGIVSRMLRKPAVAFAASTGPQGDVRQLMNAKASRLLGALVRRNSRFVALSGQGHEELRRLGCRDETIVRSTNGVDLERFQPADNDCADRSRTVLYLSRLVPAKNPQLLLRAWKYVNREGQYRLLIAGDGPLAGGLRQLAHQESLQNVEFLGHVSDVAAAHRQASVFVLPSPSEGCSNALLEAMAGGLCPLATRVPGNIDVIRDGINGLLFDHDDEQQLATALSRALTDESMRARLSATARDHVIQHHDLDKIAASYVDLFLQLRAPKETGEPPACGYPA